MEWSLVSQKRFGEEFCECWISATKHGLIVVEERCSGDLTRDIYDVDEQVTRVMISPRSTLQLAKTIQCDQAQLVSKISSILKKGSADICDFMDLLDVLNVHYLYELPGDGFATIRTSTRVYLPQIKSGGAFQPLSVAGD